MLKNDRIIRYVVLVLLVPLAIYGPILMTFSGSYASSTAAVGVGIVLGWLILQVFAGQTAQHYPEKSNILLARLKYVDLAVSILALGVWLNILLRN